MRLSAWLLTPIQKNSSRNVGFALSWFWHIWDFAFSSFDKAGCCRVWLPRLEDIFFATVNLSVYSRTNFFKKKNLEFNKRLKSFGLTVARREEGGWFRKLHNAKLFKYDSGQSNKRVRRTECIQRTGKIRNRYKILVGNAEGKRQFRD